MGPVIPEPENPPRPRTGHRLAAAGAVGAVLAVGGVAVAQAAAPAPSSPSATPSATPSGSPSGSAAPGKDAPRERTPRLAGTVVSASGGTITITDFQGFQRTIRTSGDTEYSEGLTATPAAGTRIVAEGTIADDKTSLDATRVSALPDRPEGLPGRPGGPGRGFPGHGPGDHPDRPDSSATPSPGTPSASPSTPSPSPSTPSPSPTG